MKNMSGYKRSFTIVELMIVMGILAILFAFMVVNVGTVQESAYLSSNLDVLISDMKQQQLKAMIGDTEGRATGDHYGIYFQQNQYTLFHGSVYNSNDVAGNFIVKLAQNVQFVTPIPFPNSSLIFNQVSGEFINYASGSNTVTIRSTVGGSQKTITVNRYGVITQVN